MWDDYADTKHSENMESVPTVSILCGVFMWDNYVDTKHSEDKESVRTVSILCGVFMWDNYVDTTHTVNRESVLTVCVVCGVFVRQPVPNHPSGHLGCRATPWSAEKMLDGQHQRLDIPAHARTAHNSLLQKRLEEDLC